MSQNKSSTAKGLSRRQFLYYSALAAAATAGAGAITSCASTPKPRMLGSGDKLRIGCVGCGGKGRSDVQHVSSENIVALCDADSRQAVDARKVAPNAKFYYDWREMLEKEEKNIDAITVSTPDHLHAVIASAAIKMGKHVYCQKPLTQTVYEARYLRDLAKKHNVITQMGNQGSSEDGLRRAVEIVHSGLIGPVKQIHVWTNRPVWPQGVVTPSGSDPVPPEFKWDYWIGPAAMRPFKDEWSENAAPSSKRGKGKVYAPFVWRGWFDFGTGALGDMGCHILDGAFWALGLDAPSRIEAISGRANELSAPTSSMITYHFPAQGTRPAIKWTWYDGGLQPQLPADWEDGRQFPINGTLVVGSNATVLTNTYYESVRLIPEARMKALGPTLPAKTLPRVEGGHFAEWIRACKGGPAAGSNFQYAAKLTELCLLSNIAVRCRRPIEWDAAAMKVTNLPSANQYITKEYRAGFGV